MAWALPRAIHEGITVARCVRGESSLSDVIVVDRVASRRRWLLLCVGLLLLNALVTQFLWNFLSRQDTAGVQQVMQENSSRQDELRQNADQENRWIELERENRRMRSAALVKKGTLDELRRELGDLQEQLYRGDEELRFYRSITANTQGASGLFLHGIHIEPAGEAGHYLCKIFLTNLAKNVKLVKGTLELQVEGDQAGDAIQLETAELLPGGEPAVNYEFRHFLRWENRLVLPGDFQPQRIRVKLIPEGRGLKPLEKSFDWPLEPPLVFEDEE